MARHRFVSIGKRLTIVLVLGLLLSGCGAPDATSNRARVQADVAPTVRPTPTPTPRPVRPIQIRPEGTVSRSAVVGDVANDREAKDLLAALRQRGISMRLEGRSQVAFLSPSPGQTYSLGRGRGELYVHAYPSVERARTVADSIPANADNGLTDWAGRPNFYRCGRLLVLYLGKESKVINVLEPLCGPPFAEGEGF